MGKLDGKNVAIIATDGFEEIELKSPREALIQEGARVEILSPNEGSIRAWRGKEWGNSLDVDRDVSQARADEYDALVLPGGVINADHLRVNEDVVRLVGEFFEGGKPVAAICHAPWVLIETDAVHGRRMTSYPSLKTDLLNAGADWVDEPTVEDENLLTSRAPPDLPRFNAHMVELFATWQASAPEGEDRVVPLRPELAEPEGEPVAGVEPLPADIVRPLPKRKKPEPPPAPAGRPASRSYASRRPPPRHGGKGKR